MVSAGFPVASKSTGLTAIESGPVLRYMNGSSTRGKASRSALTEPWPIAFGRYLRTLRERRGLSLADASRMSRPSVAALDKGTLSRFERGQQRLPASKLIPLSRIYGVSPGALAERLELDMELDRVGGSDVEGRTRAELQEIGTEALRHRHSKWIAYSAFREALFRPSHNGDSFADEQEELGARIHFAMAARALGKNRVALHEFSEIEGANELPARRNAVILDRISNCYRCLGDFTRSERYANAAIDEASHYGEKRILAFAHASKASIALDQGAYSEAVAELQEASRANLQAREVDCLLAPSPSFDVTVLLKLTEAYLELRFKDKARKTATAAKTLSLRAVLPGGLGYGELFLGQLDDTARDVDRARMRWQRASKIGASIHDNRLSFAAEYFCYRSTTQHGEIALARAAAKRLERLVPWVPEHFPLLTAYRRASRTHLPRPDRPQARRAQT